MNSRTTVYKKFLKYQIIHISHTWQMWLPGLINKHRAAAEGVNFLHDKFPLMKICHSAGKMFRACKKRVNRDQRRAKLIESSTIIYYQLIIALHECHAIIMIILQFSQIIIRGDKVGACGIILLNLIVLVRSCKISEFSCKGSGICLPLDKYCDGIDHCGDFSDEPKFCTGEWNSREPISWSLRSNHQWMKIFLFSLQPNVLWRCWKNLFNTSANTTMESNSISVSFNIYRLWTWAGRYCTGL